MSITQSDTLISSANNIAQISFVRNGHYVHGLGYKQNSSAFGFGQGLLSNFQPSFLCIDPGSGRTGINNINPEYTFDVSSLNTAFRSGYGGGLLISWNASSGQGETNFWNYRGGGPGAFWFKNRDISNTDVGWSNIQCGSGWFNGSVDINSNGEVLRLRGTDHAYTRYIINGINRAYTGFPAAGNQTFHVLNEFNTSAFSHLIWGLSTTDLMRAQNGNNTGYASCNWSTPAWNVSAGVGGGVEPSGLFRNKYYIYQNGPALVLDTNTYTGLGITSPTQQLDVNGNIRTRNSFTSNNVDFFTYSQTDFTPTIGFLTGVTNNFVPVVVGGTVTTFAYTIQTGRITRIGNIITVVVDIQFNIQLSVAAAPGIYIAIRLPFECRPNSLGATAGGGWPASINAANMKGYVLLNGTDAGGNIAYISPVDQNERMLWSIYGVGLNNNQRLFPTITYCLR